MGWWAIAVSVVSVAWTLRSRRRWRAFKTQAQQETAWREEQLTLLQQAPTALARRHYEDQVTASAAVQYRRARRYRTWMNTVDIPVTLALNCLAITLAVRTILGV